MGVLASDGQTNLSGSNKAKALVARFGEKGLTTVATTVLTSKSGACSSGRGGEWGGGLVKRAQSVTALGPVLRPR